MEVKRLSVVDAAEYRKIMLDAYLYEPDAFTSSFSERHKLPLIWWENRLSGASDPTQITFGVFNEFLIAGVVGLTFQRREKLLHKSKIVGLYIYPEFRNQGFGKALVSAALLEAQARRHMKVVQLTVSEDHSAARQIYHSLGFRSFGIEPFAVISSTGFINKVHMYLDVTRSG